MRTLRRTLNIYQSNLIQNSSCATYREGVDCISGSLYKSFCDSDEKGAQRSRAGEREGCPEAGQQHEAWVAHLNSPLQFPSRKVTWPTPSCCKLSWKVQAPFPSFNSSISAA